MLNIIVRSKRDVDAVKAMLRKHYSGWNISVYSLHGARNIDDVYDRLKNIVTDNEYYILLLGREDQRVYEEIVYDLPPNIVAHIVPRARIRNTRLEHLAYELSIARSVFRLNISWDNGSNTFLLGSRKGVWLENYEINPAYDIFFGLGIEYNRVLEEVIGSKICMNPLIVRRFGGVHDIYCGRYRRAVLKIPDQGLSLNGEVLNNNYIDIDLDRLLSVNKHVLEVYEKIAVNLLNKYREWVDTVIIPWSGGKDSTVALYLALKVFPRSIVKAVYVDTGVEFPCTREYVYKLSRKLGVELYTVYVGIDKGLLEESLPLPTHDNRWCTGRKIEGIEKMVKKLSSGNTLVITGDRDSESIKRSNRPITRWEENRLVVSPLKMWSTAHIQLYLLHNNIPINPLYRYGFYRIGCYICPALRSWELYIMMKNPEINKKLEQCKLYKIFIEKHLNR